MVKFHDRKIIPRKIAPWKIAPLFLPHQIPSWAWVWVMVMVGCNLPVLKFPEGNFRVPETVFFVQGEKQNDRPSNQTLLVLFTAPL